MRIKVRMVGNFGTFTVGEIVNPTAQLANQMIASKVAVPVNAEPARTEPEQTEAEQPKKTKKK